MTEKEIEELTHEFKKLDVDNTGLLTSEEIKKGMLDSGLIVLDLKNE